MDGRARAVKASVEGRAAAVADLARAAGALLDAGVGTAGGGGSGGAGGGDGP
jgi:hypothetical protein